MEKEVVSYVKHHSFQVIVVVVGVFIILAIGEFVLYRKTQELNQMISEGVMQIKEEVQTNETQPDEFVMKEGNMMMKKGGFLMMMAEEMMLPNGTKVMTNGDVVKSDGTKEKLKEGQRMNIEGMMVP